MTNVMPKFVSMEGVVLVALHHVVLVHIHGKTHV